MFYKFNFIILILIILKLFQLGLASTCKEGICDSKLSKCILTQNCKCEQKDLQCYKDCVHCMGEKHFKECCSCIDLCPKVNKVKPSLYHKSHVEDFEGVPELFNNLVLPSADELKHNWNIFTFPINNHSESVLKVNRIYNEYHVANNKVWLEANLAVNCTVVYFDHCVSWNKCRQSCRNIGASSYRWFHDGCCECIGSTCLNYGINESRCKFCPEEDDEEFHEVNAEDDYDEFKIFKENFKYD